MKSCSTYHDFVSFLLEIIGYFNNYSVGEWRMSETGARMRRFLYKRGSHVKVS
jgi:hypothetical protein